MNGMLEEPRRLLVALGAQVKEMPRHGTQSFCCGAGGAQMWKEEETGCEAVTANRYREAMQTVSDVVATACPLCLTMLRGRTNGMVEARLRGATSNLSQTGSRDHTPRKSRTRVGRFLDGRRAD